MSTSVSFDPPGHPVLRCVASMEAALKDVADVNPAFMSVADKKATLVALARVAAKVSELGMRVLSEADDVALEDGARDAGAWLAHRTLQDRGQAWRQLRLGRALDRRWVATGRALRDGQANLAQVEAIVTALEELPDDLDPEVVAQAEAHLLAQAADFGPRALRVLGRRVLAVVAPDLDEDRERKLLEREEAAAARSTFLRTRRRGDGTTELIGRISDTVADRLLTYLNAYTSPRRTPATDSTAPLSGGAAGGAPDDRRPYDQRLGHAFGAFLEAVDPDRMPLHGGDATTVLVTIDLASLRDEVGVAMMGGDTLISASQARRLACTAGIIPVVLGGNSEILDLGRKRRLFVPAQRRAMAVRDGHCRAEGCEIPAAWCEAHHAGTPWASGGRTDLDEGALLCSFHHHLAHDHRYQTVRRPDGAFTFHRRT